MNPTFMTLAFKKSLDFEYGQATALVARTAFAQCQISPTGTEPLTQNQRNCLESKSPAIWNLLDESYSNLKTQFESEPKIGSLKFGGFEEEESDE